MLNIKIRLNAEKRIINYLTREIQFRKGKAMFFAEGEQNEFIVVDMESVMSVKETKRTTEKHLDRLAIKYEKDVYDYSVLDEDYSNQQNIFDIDEAYKRGYRDGENKLES